MSSKDPKIILTVKIFADKQTKFRCETILTFLHVSGFIEETHNCRLCPCSADLRHQITITCQCSLLSDQTTFIVH